MEFRFKADENQVCKQNRQNQLHFKLYFDKIHDDDDVCFVLDQHAFKIGFL